MLDPLANPRPLIRRVYAYAAYRLGDGADAEDVTSETFERALRYRNTFDPRVGDPAAWLIGIAGRCVADALLRREPSAGEPPESSVDSHDDDALRRIELRAAVAALGKRDRELLALHYGADLTARQIAELLDLRTNAVEVALHRAVRRLRAVIESAEPAGGAAPGSFESAGA